MYCGIQGQKEKNQARASSAIHNNYFRDYNPQTGRYSTGDPLGIAVGANLYSYVRSTPLNTFDSLGLKSKGGAGPTQKGKAGEHKVSCETGRSKNKTRIPCASGKKDYRVPDFMDPAGRDIIESKNQQGPLHLSSQILDDKAYVGRGGGPGRVEVRVNCITLPLLREHLNQGSPIKLKSTDF